MAQQERPVGSGEAARLLGVHRTTLLRWWQDGKVKPLYTTPGGQARWLMSDLRRQLGGHWVRQNHDGP
ncbi:helix-turn-helix domain-containing protein [Saccharomonospora sp. NPDC046836]|uniref:helix-turn-helix domain-containing protein n=1 Tax=Saccharomonospora sp. NPDC046836 TaxID=3156921 RepID=UPI0034038BA0